MTNIINIDTFLTNLSDDELLCIKDKNNLNYDDINEPFSTNTKLLAIKYKPRYETSQNFEISRFKYDIVTNIKTNKNTKLLIDGKEYNINNTLPLMVMTFTDIKIIINEPTIITYDAYLLSIRLRDNFMKKSITNNDGSLFRCKLLPKYI